MLRIWLLQEVPSQEFLTRVGKLLLEEDDMKVHNRASQVVSEVGYPLISCRSSLADSQVLLILCAGLPSSAVYAKAHQRPVLRLECTGTIQLLSMKFLQIGTF